jgi:hypothetical protein
MQIVYDPKIKHLSDAWTDVQKRVAKAATAAMWEAGETAVREGRQQIAAAGFKDGYFPWQKSFKATNFPLNGRDSLRPAVRVRHMVYLASVFEFGTTIGPRSRSLMWLPLEKNLPPGFRGGPSKFPGKLYSVKKASGRPLLVGRKPGSRDRVPMFVGVARATMPKKFHLYDVIQKAADRLEEFYVKHFQAT